MYAQTVDSSPGDHERLAEAATEALQLSPYHSVRTVLCESDRGSLFLRGRLSSFHHKQVAQETVARIKGETPLVNQIEVD
jgi:osmotically-inducible protein OsmY